MRQWLAPAFLGALLLALGIYFFPFGQDVIFAFTLDYAGGDYWLAWAYLYLVCGAFIFVGYMLLRHGYAGVAQPLVIIPVLLVVLIVLRVV